MANQILARLGIVMGVDSGELEVGLAAAKEKFKGFTQEVQRQTNEAAKQTMALKLATESYGKTLTQVEKLELELKYGRMAGNMVEEKTLNLLRQQAAAYDAVKAAADKANKAKGGAGLNQYQQQAIMYQTTDTITSLMGGQNPFMVLMQQGGQLKDQFGGLRPMFAGLAAAITPAGVALTAFGTAVAGTAYAMYKGHEEQKQFNNMLILTGHYLNMTEAQFSSLSKTVSTKYNVSLSDTRAAMQAVAATGQFTATSLSSVVEVVARMSKLTGETASTVASSLIPSLDGTAASAKRLNDQYHFLTVAQYTQIRQLEAQGRLQDSVKLTANALSASLNKQKEELGSLEKAWKSVTEGIGNFWQSLKDLGKTPDLDRQVAAAWNAVGIALKRAESENATELDKQMLANAKARYEKLALERGKKMADDLDASIKAEDDKKKIDDIALGRAAKARQLRNEAEDFDEKTRAANAVIAGDKISQIEEDRVKKMMTAIRAAKRANEDDDFAQTTERAKRLAAELISINAQAAKDEKEVYAKAKESYRESAQSEQDALDKEKERIAFYKEHIFLQGSELQIAESRLKTEQAIAAIYAKKDGGLKSDKDVNAERLRDIQKQREAVIDQGAQLKMLQDMNQSVYSNMGSAIDNFVRTGKFAFKDFTRSVIQDLIAIAMKAQMMAMFKGFSFFGGGGSISGPSSSVSTWEPAGFASGGEPPVGVPSIVGENGPELFIPKTAGTIIPNGQFASAMSGSSGPVFNGPYIANMSAIDTQSGIQFLSRNKQAVWAANQSAQRSLPVSR